MKRLGLLWDPENPLTPVAPVVAALRERVEIVDLSFDRLGHRTLPNGAYALGRVQLDGLLWIEGGPLPKDLHEVPCVKAAWIVNPHLEPTLLEETGELFDIRFCALQEACADERARWLPLSVTEREALDLPAGVSVLIGDPKPVAHMVVERRLRRDLAGLSPSRPVVVALGEAGRLHPLFFDSLRAGAAVISDAADLRGVVHVGEHAELLTESVRALVEDPARLETLSRRGPEIVRHLHEPALRAAQIVDTIWPRARVFGTSRPSVSVLVTCHRYLRRLKVCLESLARQTIPLEIVVADPESPDGLAEYLPEFAARHPRLRVVHLPLDGRYHRNRGVGINRAFDVSSGRIIVSIDGDIVFTPHTFELFERELSRAPDQVLGLCRVFVDRTETERVLGGEVDPFADFERLAKSPGDGEENSLVGVLGYCQAVHRAAFAGARYPEEFDRVNQSDIVFVERLGWFGVRPRFLEQERALHLWHPRNWSGTTELL